MPNTQEQVKELDYEDYQARQGHELTLGQLEARAEQLGIGGRSIWQEGRWAPAPYPGYAMQAMASQSPPSLCLELQEIQHQIVRLAQDPWQLYPLPASSFHQTVANTFSADRLERHITSRNLDAAFPSTVAAALEEWRQRSPEPSKVSMSLIGVALFRTAIGLLGTFERRQDFERVIAFRDHFYSRPSLEALGLRRTRPFIGHITLAYVEDTLDGDAKSKLTEGIHQLNQRIKQQKLTLEMPVARLHRYETLSHFRTQPDYPAAAL